MALALTHLIRTQFPGDTLKVHVKVVEGSRERVQLFEGVVIKRRGGGISDPVSFAERHAVFCAM